MSKLPAAVLTCVVAGYSKWAAEGCRVSRTILHVLIGQLRDLLLLVA